MALNGSAVCYLIFQLSYTSAIPCAKKKKRSEIDHVYPVSGIHVREGPRYHMLLSSVQQYYLLVIPW